MVTAATLTANLTLESASFIRNLEQSQRALRRSTEQMSRDVSGLRRSFDEARGRVERLGDTISSLQRLAIGLFAGQSVASGLLSFTRAAETAERQMFQLHAIIAATGGAAGLTAEQIDRFARDLARTTLASTEDIRRAAGVLVTFGAVAGEQFTRTLRLAQDLSSVFGTSLLEATRKLGKVLSEPASRLGELAEGGIVFSQSVKETIQRLVELGETAKAQEIVLRELEKRIGGAGAAEAGGLAGAIDSLAQEWEEFKEAIVDTGVVIKAIDSITAALRDLRATVTEGVGSILAPETQLGSLLGRIFRGGGGAADPAQDERKQVEELERKLQQSLEHFGGESFSSRIIRGQLERAQNRLRRLEEERELREDIARLQHLGELLTEQSVESNKRITEELEKQRKAREDRLRAESERGRAMAARISVPRNRDAILAEREVERQQDLLERRREMLRRVADIDREAAREQAEIWRRPFENAFDSIQAALTDTFERMLTNGINSFRELFDVARSIATRWAAEMATLLVLRPQLAVNASGPGGGLGGFLPESFLSTPLVTSSLPAGAAHAAGVAAVPGGLLNASTALTRFTVGNALAAFGLGTVGGGLIGGLLGAPASGSFGGGLGALAGAALGSVVPGVGQVLGGIIGGGLGSVVGGLFGRKSSKNEANIVLDFATGAKILEDRSPGAGDPNRQAVRALAEEVRSLVQFLRVDLGVELPAYEQKITVSRTQSAAEEEADILRSIRKRLRVDDDLVNQIIQKSAATTIDELVSDLQLAKSVREFEQGSDSAKSFVRELAQLRQTFDDLEIRARGLGLSLETLAEMERRAVDKLLEQAEAAVLQQRDTVSAFFGQRIAPLESALAQFTFGPLSTVSPAEQFAAAREQFRSLVRQARAGDEAAFAQVPTFAQTFLQEAREFGASGSVFRDAFREVNRVLGEFIDRERAARDSILASLPADLRDAQRDVVEELRQQTEQLTAELRALRREVARQRQRAA